MSLARINVATAVVAVAATALPAAAELVAYEGFDYGAGPNLALANGGEGWSSAWFKLSTIPTGVGIDGLSWPGLPASGRSALTAPYQNADYTRYSRGLLAYSAPNDEIWISFLLRPNVGYGVGGGLAFGTWDTGMIVGIATGTGHYGLAGTQGPTSASSTPLVQDQTVLLVSRAQVSSEGFIVWSLYVNPELEGGAPTTPDAQLEVPGTTLPQALMIYNDGGFSTDEIRVATTWASAVAEEGEPCPADLDADGAVGVSDLLLVLSGWGAPGVADLDGSGVVDFTDLTILLADWGACG